MNYNSKLITSGININCDDLASQIGVEKDLLLVNYSDFDRETTLANIEQDNSNNNKGGVTQIEFYEGAVLHKFEGTDYSVIPSFSIDKREDNSAIYTHSISFTVYNKTSEARNTLLELENSKVLAVVIDRSTGLFEMFGVDSGLILNNLDRSYTGSQKSNFYNVSIETPKTSNLKESAFGTLAVGMRIIDEESLQSEMEYSL